MINIEVMGLGAGELEQLPLGIYRKLKRTSKRIIARTEDHPVIKALIAEGLKIESYDDIYEAYDTFHLVYQEIVQRLIETSRHESLIYIVPGHPMLAEQTVQLLLAQDDVKVHIQGGQSFLDAMFTALKVDPIEGFQLIDATSFDRSDLNYHQHMIFAQVYDPFIASEVKLTLLEDLPADYLVYLIEAAGSLQEKKQKVTLENLDRIKGVSNLTSVYVPPVTKGDLTHSFETLKTVIATLRGPEGCDWDKAQTHHTLKKYLLEETYELFEAIDTEDDEAIVEELGDVLLQVLLHSQIGKDAGYFTIDDVIQSITEKMIYRHPRVFGGDTTLTWEELKQQQKKEIKQTSALQNVNRSLPSLERAKALKSEAAKKGFDWTTIQAIWQKFDEEREEFLQAVEHRNANEMEAEFGDLLFVLVNIANFYSLSPELAMHHANQKFEKRFNRMINLLNKPLSSCTENELTMAWKKVKEEEKCD